MLGIQDLMNVLRSLFYVDRMVHFVAKYDTRIEPPIEGGTSHAFNIEDRTSHAFDDWFKDAYKYVDEDGYIRDSRYPDGWRSRR